MMMMMTMTLCVTYQLKFNLYCVIESFNKRANITAVDQVDEVRDLFLRERDYLYTISIIMSVCVCYLIKFQWLIRTYIDIIEKRTRRRECV